MIPFVIAIGIGVIAAVLGVGGGFLMVPVFTILFGLDQKMAVGTSLAVIVATSFSGSFAFARQGRIFYRAAVVMIIPGIIGAVIGGFVTAVLPGSWLALIFSGVIIFFAVAMLSGDRTLIYPITMGPSFQRGVQGPVFHLYNDEDVLSPPHYLGITFRTYRCVMWARGWSYQCTGLVYPGDAYSFCCSKFNVRYLFYLAVRCRGTPCTWAYPPGVCGYICNRRFFRSTDRIKTCPPDPGRIFKEDNRRDVYPDCSGDGCQDHNLLIIGSDSLF